MLQAHPDVDLAQESIVAERDRELRKEHLDRDGPVVPQVAGEVYGRHAAAPELALERVAAHERMLEHRQ